METAILVRHAESELNVGAILNGDRSVACPLTEHGRAQARELGEAARPDLVVTSSFQRTRETAELAWPDVPRLEEPGFDEIAFGRWEGQPYEAYTGWAWTAGPLDDAPGGGESRAAALARYVEAYRRVLARPEPSVAVVAHGLVIRYVLQATEGLPPQAKLEGVPSALPFTFDRDELAAAIDVLEDWLREPAWR
jgi:2,3-bisphosphoglycerate-dependent phosphoglycerate mutase